MFFQPSHILTWIWWISSSFCRSSYWICTFSQDGFIYCLPSNARQILRLGSSDSEAEPELWGPDFGEETWKWTVAVVGPEGAIWGIPGVLGSIMIQMMDDERWMSFFLCVCVGGGLMVRMLGEDDGGEDFRCHLDRDLRKWKKRQKQ